MISNLEYEALAAELRTVEQLLARRTEEVDPIGYMQFGQRKTELEAELAQLAGDIAPRTEIGFYFDGDLMRDPRGINADFAGRMLRILPSLFARPMLVTALVSGGTGFVLEAADEAWDSSNAPLSAMVYQCLDMLTELSNPAFPSSARSVVDPMRLNTLRQFLADLDAYQATVCIAIGDRELSLDSLAISLALKRLTASAADAVLT